MMSKDVMIVTGAGQISMAIARRVGLPNARQAGPVQQMKWQTWRRF